MAISSYAELKTAIGDWMFDSGTTIAPFYDNFIQLAEARFHNGNDTPDKPEFNTPPLRVREMETTGTEIAVSSGLGSLPADLLEVIRLRSDADSPRTLKYATPDWYSEAYPTGESTTPTFYTVSGSSIVSPVDLLLDYYARIPTLVAGANTSNWLLVKAPSAYLYGCCLEAAILQGDQEQGLQMAMLLRGVLSSLGNFAVFDKAGTFEKRAAGPTP